MTDQADAKFHTRILWLGIIVAAIVMAIAFLRVDALRASVPESAREPASATTVQDSVTAVDREPKKEQKSLIEETMLSGGSEEPKLLDSQFAVKRILEFDEPFVHGFWIWDDEGVPDGELIITVDLKAESMSVFRDGYEIGAAVISFGDALKPTPTGVFPITQKSKDHVSNIYGTPMPYMLRMTNDGISIHGANVRWGWGTRGCIGVPTEFAAKLFEQVKLGDRVIVTDGKMLQIG